MMVIKQFLFFEINGSKKEKFECKLSTLLKDVVKRVVDTNDISEKNGLLVIFNYKRIELDRPIGESKIGNSNLITIIFDI